jgi:dipeptidyl aminopeptidase/acylaminoacyl peptidase
VTPFGSWESPITAGLIVAGSVSLGGVRCDGDDVYWLEGRPAERGRIVLVRRMPDGRTADVTPPGFNTRTRVHEYGGGAALVADGAVYFASFADQRLYRLDLRPGGARAPAPLTPDTPGGALRYADLILDRQRGRLICVREDHTTNATIANGGEPANTLVAVGTLGQSLPDGGCVLVSGDDFYAAPRLSPDGRRLAWLTWNHPNMPWDGCELWLGDLHDDGEVANHRLIAGGPAESIFQPEWSPDGVLHFVSDRTGWWNLYRWHDGSPGGRDGRDGQVEALTEQEGELGLPQWQLGMSTYAFVEGGQIVCCYQRAGSARLALLDPATRRLQDLAQPFTTISSVHAAGSHVVFVGASPAESPCVARLDLGTRRVEVLRRSSDVVVDPACISVAQPIEFPTEGGLTAHGFYYPPRNPGYIAPPGERPPLLVKSHGGPTSATSSALSLHTQFWTSRGIAVLDVNYGGSTGYGRAYRERLKGRWGIVDVDDCVNGARFLAAQGLVDGHRLAITGGSAGGYTTLCALTFRDVFCAGASHYGVSDLEALARDTHKFESRYLDGLVGPYPARRDLYAERSPIHHVARLSCPVIFFQGTEDPIVPPNQAERMVAALERKRVPVAYLPFEGEQHGFRRAENIKRALEAELCFYARVFGFDLAGPVDPVPISSANQLPHRARRGT